MCLGVMTFLKKLLRRSSRILIKNKRFAGYKNGMWAAHY